MFSNLWRKVLGWVWLAFFVPAAFVVLQFILNPGSGNRSALDAYLFPLFPLALLISALLGIFSERYPRSVITDACLFLPFGFYVALVLLSKF